MDTYTARIAFVFLLFFKASFGFGQDTVAPVVVSPANDTTFECGMTPNLIDKLTTWYNDHAGAQFSDDSGSFGVNANLTLAQAITIFTNSLDIMCGNTQKVEVTFTAVDAAGNVSTPTLGVFSTKDMTPPAINTVPNVQYFCVQGIRDTLITWIKKKGGYIATDLCSNTLQWTNFTYTISSNGLDLISGGGSISAGPYPMIPDGICNWILRINFFVRDECGNQTLTPAITTFSVVDNVAPVFAPTATNIIVDCNNVPSAMPPTVVDYCDKSVIPTVQVSSTQALDTLSCNHYNYTLTRSWTATDECGNSSSLTQIIAVQDTTPPVVVPNPSVSISCATYAEHPDSIYIKFSDQCSHVIVTFKDSTLISGCTTVVKRSYTLVDVCGNRSVYHQTLNIKNDKKPIIAANAQNETYQCTDQEDFNAKLFLWIQKRASAVVNAGCSSFSSFAALKNSYNISDPTTFPGTAPSVLPSQSCPSPLKGFLRHLEVDFVYFDTCGNTAVTSAIFGVRDTLSPLIDNCTNKITVVTHATTCQQSVKLQVPNAIDDCVESSAIIHKNVSASLISSQPPGPESIVDPVLLKLGPFNPNTASPVTNGIIQIKMTNMDIDDITEYFTIYDEDGNNIGITPVGAGQCASTFMTISVNMDRIAAWISDGFIDLRFVPNIVPGSPVFSINNICGGSQIEANIEYNTDITNALMKSYTIDNEPLIPLSGQDSIIVFLEGGQHVVTFFAEDCAQNKSSCKVNIDVKDATPPVLTCPQNIKTSLSPSVCRDTIPLPINFSVFENCNGNRTYNQISPGSNEAASISFGLNPATNTYEAKNKQIIFTNVFISRFVNKDVNLEIQFFGDNNEVGEVFEILGPSGYKIGTTSTVSDAGCQSLSISKFAIPINVFNTWIINNTVTILAVPVNGNDGINPCKSLTQGQTVDGKSYIKGVLRYTDLSFSVSSVGATTFGNQKIPDDIFNYNLVFNGGKSLVTLQTSDMVGNTTTCSFEVEIVDTEKPVARCKNAVINIDPSGLISTIIAPDMVDNGSTDNCHIASLRCEPADVTCAQVNTDVQVKLIVEDDFGNMDTCIALVKVKPYEIKPTFTAGLCANDTLKLFANLPPTTLPGTYTFRWDGPGSIEFFTENPTIPNADESYNGVYILTVTGFNGCVSMGSVTVNIKPLTNPVLTANEKEICQGSEVLMSTTVYTGDIYYDWYEGIFPTGILLRSTQSADILVQPTILGAHFYYVVARGPNCSSNPSPLLKITVQEVPIAGVKDLFLSPCEGDDIALSSLTNNPKFHYQWFGPAGYMAQGATPTIIQNINSSQTGNYLMIVNNGKCFSDTVTTRVEIFARPSKPTIIGADIFCPNVVFSLVATGSDAAEKFEWFLDGVLFTTTTDNSLIINNAQSTLQGTWTVRAIQGSCASLVSAAKFIAIDVSLEIGVVNSGPVCLGDSVTLQATFVPTAHYHWSGPVANIPSISNPTILGVPGDYAVTITTNTGCKNNANTTVSVIQVPEITALSNDALTCMKPSDVITFKPSVFPNSNNYTYQWTGPNGFKSSLKNPVLTALTEQDTGTYILTIFNGHCPSIPFSTKVNFSILPPKPRIMAGQFFCEGDTLLVLSDGIQNANYIWTTPLGKVTTSLPKLALNNVAQQNEGLYSLIVQSGICASPSSDTIQIDVRNKPSQPTIMSNSPICFGDTLVLNASTINASQYIWTGPVASTSSQSSWYTSDANTTHSGAYQVKVLVNGCYSDISEAVTVKVKDAIRIPKFVESSLSICKTNASGIELCLDPATLTAGATFSIYNGSNLLSNGNQSCHYIHDLQSLTDGPNAIVAYTNFEGCRSNVSLPLILNVNTPPAIKATAILDEIIACPDEIVRLEAKDGPPLVDVKWTSVNPAIVFSDRFSIAPAVSKLEDGNNIIYLDYSVAGCTDFSRDTVLVYVEFEPDATDDIYTLAYGEKGTFDILNNDNTPDAFSIQIVSGPKLGSVEIVNDQIVFVPDRMSVGEQEIIYRICADYCKNLCSEAKVIINIDKNISCKVPNVITPNGDGWNDVLFIACLETDAFPNNKVMIFNEWGEEVYYASPYKNDWKGTYSGGDLPVGTYFFVIDVGDGREALNGFLILQR
jgi:gliding motility-associated-like protein